MLLQVAWLECQTGLLGGAFIQQFQILKMDGVRKAEAKLEIFIFLDLEVAISTVMALILYNPQALK